MIKALLNFLFIFIDPLLTIKDLKAFRAVQTLIMIVCFITGHFVIDTAKTYVPIALHKWFKTEVMEAPTTIINSDLPNEDMK